MRTVPIRTALVAAVALAVVAGCSGSGASPAASTVASMTAASAAPSAATGGAMTIQGAWARETPPGTTETAVYMTITNGTGADDALVSASSPAGAAGVHEVVAVGSGDPMASAGPMMAMQPVASVPIPAGTTLELRPGSFHIMITDLKAPLKAGSTIEVTLTFQSAPPVTVTAEVRAA